MTREQKIEKLTVYAVETARETPGLAREIVAILKAADHMLELQLFTDEEIIEEASKKISYLKARTITNQIFIDAGMM